MDKNKQGFTLIELLIVATIIVVLSGTSVAVFDSFRDDKMLNNQTQLLVTVLELAKNKATAGDSSLCSDSANAHVDGYTVVVDSVTKVVSLIPGCDTTPTPILYTIPSDVVYIPTTITLQFDSKNYQGETNRFLLKNELTNKCKFIQVDETGLVTNGDASCT